MKRDVVRAATFRWITPLTAARFSRRITTGSNRRASSGLCWCSKPRNCFVSVLSSE